MDDDIKIVYPSRKEDTKVKDIHYLSLYAFIETLTPERELTFLLNFILNVRYVYKRFNCTNMCENVFIKSKISELMQNKRTHYKLKFVELMMLDASQEFLNNIYCWIKDFRSFIFRSFYWFWIIRL